MLVSDLPRLPALRPRVAWDRLASVELDVGGWPGTVRWVGVVRADGQVPYAEVHAEMAPAVKCAIRIPLDGWSQRLVYLACGGYCGLLEAPAWPSCPVPAAPLVACGMAVVFTDSGHSDIDPAGGNGLWALGNPQAVADFAYEAIGKAVRAAKGILAATFGTQPRWSYLLGCSNGGRLGLQAAQRYPDEFDGIACEAPTIDMVATNTTWHAWNARANTDAEGRAILTEDQLPALHHAALAGAGTGNRDEELGAIIDPRSLSAKAAAEAARAAPLSPAQHQVAQLLYQGPKTPQGIRLFPGGLPRGSELSWLGAMVPAGGRVRMTAENSSSIRYSTDFPRYMATLQSLRGSPGPGIEFTVERFDELDQLSGIYDPTNPDISRYIRRGGRILIWQGWADAGSSPLGTLNYCCAVRRWLGADTTDEGLQLYMVPGLGHCGHAALHVNADYVTPLVNWVECGNRPEAIRAVFVGQSGRQLTRRITPYTVEIPENTDNSGNAHLSGRDWTPWIGDRHYVPAHIRRLRPGTSTLEKEAPGG